jgi:uncharacterized protein (TIGR02646 family)
MKHIVKGQEPISFIEWKKRKKLTETDLKAKSRLQKEHGDIWDKFKKDKQGIKARGEVKQALMGEQGHLCAYCQQALEGNTFKIGDKIVLEHFIPRDIDATKMYNFDNILASCTGGKNLKEEDIEIVPKWCDYAKNNQL